MISKGCLVQHRNTPQAYKAFSGPPALLVMSDPYNITFDSAPMIDLLHPDGRIRGEFVENVKIVSQ
jgi:hypothetical protein